MWHKKGFLIFVSLVIMILTITLGGIPWSVRESSAQGGAQSLDGAVLDRWCTDHGYVGVEVDGSNPTVFGLGCKDSSGVRHGLDLIQVCTDVYGPSYANPQYSDYNNPSSWRCYPVDTPSTAIPPANPPQPTAIPPQPPVVQPPGQPEQPAQPQQPAQQQPAQQGGSSGSSNDTCGNLSSRLTVGGYARVSTNVLNMRSSPSLSASVVQELHNGNSVNVIGGPICADGYTWWQVKMFLTGWSAEGGNRYYLEPESSQSVSGLEPDFSDPTVAEISAQLQPWVRNTLMEYFPVEGNFPTWGNLLNAAANAYDPAMCLLDWAVGIEQGIPGLFMGRPVIYLQLPPETAQDCASAFSTIQGLFNALQ